MPPPRVILVAGAAGSGKSALIQRYVNAAFPANYQRTIGLETNVARVTITPAQAEDHSRLFMALPAEGIDLEFWELGGRETVKRDLPRGRPIDGLMVCYDVGDRASFQRAAHILMGYLVDRHLGHTKKENLTSGREAPAGFSGKWSKGTVFGDKMTWNDGTVTQVSVTDVAPRVISTTWNDTSYSGELRNDDKIYWSDGEVWTRGAQVPTRLAVQLCGTKAEEDNRFAVNSDELQEFVRANNLGAPLSTSAKTGDGVINVFYDLAANILEADRESLLPIEMQPHVADSWSLACPSRTGHQGPMTSPRGARPLEPQRGLHSELKLGPPLADVDKLVEVLDQHGNATGTRTLGRCLDRGLRHRAVHVWLMVPRTGALLLRRYAPNAAKHPGRWGPTVHGEILCYGSEGDGHGAELSGQAAARSIKEQLGFDASEVGALEHWFSVSTQDGNSLEVLDVHVAALKGQGLPALQLAQGEEVDWAFFGDVFSEDAKLAGTVFKAEEEYIMGMFRPLRAGVVGVDVMNAFGAAAVATLERDKTRGFPPAGAEKCHRSARVAN